MEVKWLVILVVSIVISFIIGWFLSRATIRKKYDGILQIGTSLDADTDEERDRFQFIFMTELEDLQNQKEFVMKIEHSQNSQPV